MSYLMRSKFLLKYRKLDLVLTSGYVTFINLLYIVVIQAKNLALCRILILKYTSLYIFYLYIIHVHVIVDKHNYVNN